MITTISHFTLADALINSYKLAHTEFSDMDTHIANCEAWMKIFPERFYNKAVDEACETLGLDRYKQRWF